MYDVIIIGAGPAGISASLYTKRAGKNTLIIHGEHSSLQDATKIENYYGFSNGISGNTLYNEGIMQAQNLGIEVKKEEVIKIEVKNDSFDVITTEEKYETKTIIIALGTKKKKLNIKGVKEFEGKGISYCAICDGFFYKNKDVSVIGNGKYAISEVNDLINVAEKVTILTNGETAPDFRGDNVEIITKEIKEISGADRVREVRFQDDTSIVTDGVFIAQGTAGPVEIAKKLGIILKNDKIVVNENMETNIKGIYAAGDCTGGLLQISKAVYEGTKAGLQVVEYLQFLDGR